MKSLYQEYSNSAFDYVEIAIKTLQAELQMDPKELTYILSLRIPFYLNRLFETLKTILSTYFINIIITSGTDISSFFTSLYKYLKYPNFLKEINKLDEEIIECLHELIESIQIDSIF